MVEQRVLTLTIYPDNHPCNDTFPGDEEEQGAQSRGLKQQMELPS